MQMKTNYQIQKKLCFINIVHIYLRYYYNSKIFKREECCPELVKSTQICSRYILISSKIKIIKRFKFGRAWIRNYKLQTQMKSQEASHFFIKSQLTHIFRQIYNIFISNSFQTKIKNISLFPIFHKGTVDVI